MKATRNGDTLRLELTGHEVFDHLDLPAITDTVLSQLETNEVLTDWTLPIKTKLILEINMDITALPGQSDCDIYRKENGVPFV